MPDWTTLMWLASHPAEYFQNDANPDHPDFDYEKDQSSKKVVFQSYFPQNSDFFSKFQEILLSIWRILNFLGFPKTFEDFYFFFKYF